MVDRPFHLLTSIRVRASVGMAVLCAALAGWPAVAQEPRSLAFSAGAFNVNKSPTVFEAGIEYRQPIDVWKLAIAGGLYANADGAVFVFGGLRRDFHLGGPWLITPGFGIALYEKGDSKDLGGTLEFRSALEIGHQWQSLHRVALGIYHLSNAGIHDLNPGSNSLIVTYSLPLK